MRSDLPSGTVTFLFTDVEGSTRLLHSLGTERYAKALAEHREIIRLACKREGGAEVDNQGDAFFFAFPAPEGALAAATAFTERLSETQVSVRVGIHTGAPHLTEEGYVGDDVHLAARIGSSAHGGQVVVSHATAELFEYELTSLGSHRLKDIGEPVSLYQLGDSSFPALRTIANSNLPSPASSFLGREAELVQADLLLQETRLLTIHGPGGQGKTRFALELAARAREERFSDYPDGVFGCFLSSLRDPSLVLPTIAQTLSVREQPGHSALDALSAYLQGRRLLLLLDNAEHLLDCASELSRLLSACPDLTLLVTSRELLRISGEEPYALPPLREADGIALFCERSKLEPSPQIAQIAERLEGLPLALELAAARTRILTPEQLLQRLSSRLDLLKGSRDADPRQHTLRATIEWSYELLTADEQELFARLSVFQGGCSLEAAEEVCQADLDSLQSLVDKSLLRFTDERFWMLETIREYAGEMLDAGGEAEELRNRHLEYFCAESERAAPELKRHDQLAYLDRLTADHENLRASLDHGLRGSGQPALAARLAVALVEFWDARSHYAEARSRYASVLEHRTELTDLVHGRALYGAGHAAHRQGDQVEALRLLTNAVDVFERIGEEGDLARALCGLAFVHLRRGEPGHAAETADRAAAAAERAGDPWVTACAFAALSAVCGQQGDSDGEISYLEESLRLFTEAGDRRNQAVEQLNLGAAAADRAELEHALALFADAEVNARAVGDLGFVANALTERGELLLGMGRLADAAAAFDDALELGESCGMHDVISRCRSGVARIDDRHTGARLAPD